MRTIEDTRKKAERQKQLFNNPAFTIEEREAYIKWIDKINIITNNLVYAVYPDNAWDNPNQQVQVVLVGNEAEQANDLHRGLFFIYPSIHLSDSINDALACAFAYLAKIPEDIKMVPEVVSVALIKPSAHERFGSRIFINEIISKNSDNPDILEWANRLVA